MFFRRYAQISRIRCPGVLHHVMGRSIERKNVFLNNKDRKNFINRLPQLVKEGAVINIFFGEKPAIEGGI